MTSTTQHAAPAAGPVVRAHKVVLDDDGRRVVVGFMNFGADAGRWWCEVCGRRPCRHVRAALDHAAAHLPAVAS